MKPEEAQQFAQLDKENARLKRLLLEEELEKTMLKDLAEAKF